MAAPRSHPNNGGLRLNIDVTEDNTESLKQELLFEHSPLPGQEKVVEEPKVEAPQFPVWTDNKARFIMHYLHFFVLLTKHGTYIDGFAGPQEQCETDSWAAKLVLASEPQWIKHFHLCDKSKAQISHLEGLKKVQPIRDSHGKKLYRKIHIYHGDFNAQIDKILKEGNISQKQATFCLLDQRTFECHWETLQKIARYKKPSEHKIELFYFLANGWLERALAAQKDTAVLRKWWGNGDWTKLREMSREERRDALVARIRTELGYKSVKAWPIYERDNGGAIMYYMIHATDHPEAPKFMARAYKRAVYPLEPIEQLKLDMFTESISPQSQPPTPPDSAQKTA
jgi:three-Cys-motif partner protein